MKHVAISLPDPTAGHRLIPHGRNARARHHTPSFGQPCEARREELTAFKRDKLHPFQKTQFLHDSSREASRLARERAQDRLVREFLHTLEGEDLAFADSVRLGRNLADGYRPAGAESHDALDHRDEDRREVPDAEIRGRHNGTAVVGQSHPVLDALDPLRSVSVEDLSDEEIAEAHAAFGRALEWVHQATHLVKKGRRMAALDAWIRPWTGEKAPLPFSAELAGWFDLAERRLLGLVFGRASEWCRGGHDLMAVGMRADIVAYVIRPTLLDAATNAELGGQKNNTRQAINKLVQGFRDTFAGIRAPAMRGESTRHTCRAGQLAA